MLVQCVCFYYQDIWEHIMFYSIGKHYGEVGLIFSRIQHLLTNTCFTDRITGASACCPISILLILLNLTENLWSIVKRRMRDKTSNHEDYSQSSLVFVNTSAEPQAYHVHVPQHWCSNSCKRSPSANCLYWHHFQDVKISVLKFLFYWCISFKFSLTECLAFINHTKILPLACITL